MLVEYNEFSVKRNADVYKLFRARGYYLNHISSICPSVRRLRNNCIRQKCNQCNMNTKQMPVVVKSIMVGKKFTLSLTAHLHIALHPNV